MEEPVYEAAPEQEPENDYEDVGELDRQEEDAEGDYEDVLEPENTPSLSYQAGEWGEWAGQSSSQMWSVSGHQGWRRNLSSPPNRITSVCLLHVDVSVSRYSGSSAGAGGAGTSAVALYDYQGGKFEVT